MRGADRGADRDPALARVRARHAGRAAAAIRDANRLIRALIILARVVCADETPIRVGPGPKTRKRYLLVACTSLLTCYFLGERSLASFEAFVFPDLSGAVVVHDRYQNYDKFPGITHPPAVCISPAQRPGRRRPVLPGRDLARPDRTGPARPIAQPGSVSTQPTSTA
ncbi:MAG TPA: transposase [Streptosporangiaceae bacterium]